MNVFDSNVIKRRTFLSSLKDSDIKSIGNIVYSIDTYQVSDTVIVNKSINFCYSLNCVNSLMGICFNRLFVFHVANILKKYVEYDITVDDNKIIVINDYINNGIFLKNGICNVVVTDFINDIFSCGLSIILDSGVKCSPEYTSVKISDVNKFIYEVCTCFDFVLNSIYKERIKSKF